MQQAIKGRSFSLRPERLIQLIFSIASVDRSVALGLVPDPAALMIAGDGSPLRTGTSLAGVKVCRCREQRASAVPASAVTQTPTPFGLGQLPEYLFLRLYSL